VENCSLRACLVGILVKGLYEVWGEGGSYEELEESIRSYPDERKLPYLNSGSTFKITVDTFGKVISFQEQNHRIKGLAYIPFKVCTVGPIHCLCIATLIFRLCMYMHSAVLIDLKRVEQIMERVQYIGVYVLMLFPSPSQS
jgi:hypothetical protein